MSRFGRGLTSAPLAQRSPRGRRWIAIIILVAVAVWAAVILAGDGGLLELRRERGRLVQLEVDVARLAAENDSLRQLLWKLQNDPAYVEKVAREAYGMVRPRERLYRIKPAAEDE